MLSGICTILFFALLVLPNPDYAFEIDPEADNYAIKNIAVIGRLLCYGEPQRNAFIQLYENDGPDPDDFMSEKRTDMDGRFDVAGHEDEADGIEPYIIISDVHCSANCDEKWSMRVYFGKINAFTNTPYDLGDIEMANVCANVDDKERLTFGEFLAKSKELEDYEIRKVRLNDLRYSSETRNAARELGPTVGVSGQVMCAGKPLRHLKVKLFDGATDSRLNRTHTHESGHFITVGHGEDTISPFLHFSNVNCSVRCTGHAEFKFVLKNVKRVSVLKLGKIDLAKACKMRKMEKEFNHKEYDVSGRLTCDEKSLSGAHITLYDNNPFFAYATTPQQLVDINTTDTGHFALRKKAFPEEEDLFLNISGITCGTKCKGDWHIKLLLNSPHDRFVYDLGVMEMNRVCSTHESGQSISSI